VKFIVFVEIMSHKKRKEQEKKRKAKSFFLINICSFVVFFP